MNLRSILPLGIQRQMRLVEILYISPEPLDQATLIKFWGYPEKTLDFDIRSVNLHYPNFQIEHTPQGLTIPHNLEYGIDSLYTQILTSSLEFELFEQLLFENHENIHDLARHLYTSPATISRIYKKITKSLEDINVSIARRPMRFVGDEAAIRHLFIEFYREKKEPFETLARSSKITQSVQQLITDFMEENNFSESYANQVRLEYSFYVSLIRVSKGHLFPEQMNHSEAVQMPDFIRNQRAILEIEKHFPLLFTEQTYRECFWLYYSDYLISNQHQSLIALKNNPALANLKRKSDVAVSIFEEELEIEFSVTEGKLGSIKNTIATYLTLENYLSLSSGDYISILGEYRKFFIVSHAILFPSQLEKIADATKKIYALQGQQIPEDVYIAHLFLLITQYPNLLLKIADKQHKINILILSAVCNLPENFILNRFLENLNGPIEYHFVHDLQELTGKKNWLKEIDLIISTSSISKEYALQYAFLDKPIFVIEPYLTGKGFDELQRKINQVIEEKLAS